jgi:hypothetical protein
LDALQEKVMELVEDGIEGLVEFLKVLAVVELLGEEVDEGGGGEAAVEEAEQLRAWVNALLLPVIYSVHSLIVLPHDIPDKYLRRRVGLFQKVYGLTDVPYYSS